MLFTRRFYILFCLISSFGSWHCSERKAAVITKVDEKTMFFHSQKEDFRLELVAQGMRVPWSMDWLPDGRALISDRRKGQIYLLSPRDTTLTEVCNAPDAFSYLDSGMREVLVPPNYAQDSWIYISYDLGREDSTSTLVVERAQLAGDCLEKREVLFTAQPWYKSNYHYGGRLVCRDDYLFITVGDRHFRDSAQLLHTHNGKIMRLHLDGRIPEDNPFVGVPTARPEIWSYGHRNPQGLALQPGSNQLWENEHGPKGGDEINIIQKGLNYGWPAITFGEEYEGGPVGKGLAHQTGMEQPFRHYSPSVAPSGLTFYSGAAFSQWKGNLFFCAMSQRNLYRLTIEEGRIRGEERLLERKGWRIRFIEEGPDGLLYFGTTEGEVWRMKPI